MRLSRGSRRVLGRSAPALWGPWLADSRRALQARQARRVPEACASEAKEGPACGRVEIAIRDAGLARKRPIEARALGGRDFARAARACEAPRAPGLEGAFEARAADVLGDAARPQPPVGLEAPAREPRRARALAQRARRRHRRLNARNRDLGVTSPAARHEGQAPRQSRRPTAVAGRRTAPRPPGEMQDPGCDPPESVRQPSVTIDKTATAVERRHTAPCSLRHAIPTRPM